MLGQKNCGRGNVLHFYKNKIIRILIPYYILLLGYIVLYICGLNQIGFEVISNIICLQWVLPSLRNTGHFWYISCILICYLITPLLQKIVDAIKIGKKGYWVCVCSSLIIISLLTIVTSPINLLFIFTYILGYTYSRLYRTIDDTEIDVVEKILIIFGYLFIITRIIIEYGFSIKINNIIGDITEIMFSFSFLLTLKKIIKNNNSENLNCIQKIGNRIIKFFDGISYEVYLTHHIFILGVLSVMNVTNSKIINVLIALVLTIFSAWLLNLCVKFLNNIILKKNKKDYASNLHD